MDGAFQLEAWIRCPDITPFSVAQALAGGVFFPTDFPLTRPTDQADGGKSKKKMEDRKEL